MDTQRCNGKNIPIEKRRKNKRSRRIVKVLAVLMAVLSILFLQRKVFPEERGFFGNERLHILTDEEEISDKLVPGKIPLYLQKDRRWKKEKYGDDTMEITGCGPTCLSMVVCGLRQDEIWTPIKVARKVEREGYYVKGSGSSWSLMKEGAEEFGLTVEELSLEEGKIRNRLENGEPVICVVGAGDFTTEGHFIVLSEQDKEGKIIVKDPNSRERSEKRWDLQHIMPQIKNLWAYSLE